jgi:molybdate transport system substrate-binding protein
MRHRLKIIAALLLSFVPFACGPAEPRGPTSERELVVFAAASLRDVFTTLQGHFTRAHPGVELTFNFAGTQELRTQLEQGARADVFASADHLHMAELVAASLATSPVIFARNEPVMVVAKEAATTIRGLADLPTAPRIVIGTPEVPIGRYTLSLLDRASLSWGADFRAQVEARVASRELNVRQVLNKVRLGEAQAGVVYKSDAEAARGQVEVVTIPPDINVVAEYPIAVLAGAAHPKLARAWLSLVLSADGQRVLGDAGFLAPSESSSSP